MPCPRIIAIDGPAASGKTTIGKKLAEALNYLFFDTGVMYRAVTWLALLQGLNLDDEKLISDLAENSEIDVRTATAADGRTCDILVNEEDITWQIRRPEIDANVSQVSAYPRVRKSLTEQQRRIGLRGEVVMVGRDIGTVVLPEAELKIYLDASAEERARRRYHEIIQRGATADYEEILAGVKQRDQIDSTRVHAPLRIAEDAIVIDSDNLSIDQVYQTILNLIKED